MRKAFTLIEMLVAVSILSIIMIFLYKSYASLNQSNEFFNKELNRLINIQEIKKNILLDFTFALENKTTILNQNKKEDIVFTQTINSLHKRYNPYIAYVISSHKLYRLESLYEFKEYPLEISKEFVADFLGEINHFRIYKSKKDDEAYLVDIDFKGEENILMKIKTYN